MAVFGGQFYLKTCNAIRNFHYLKFCLVSSPVICCVLKAICMHIKLLLVNAFFFI